MIQLTVKVVSLVLAKGEFFGIKLSPLQLATQYHAQFDQGIQTFNRPLYRKLNSHFLSLYVSYSSRGEKLLKYQLNSST